MFQIWFVVIDWTVIDIKFVVYVIWLWSNSSRHFQCNASRHAFTWEYLGEFDAHAHTYSFSYFTVRLLSKQSYQIGMTFWNADTATGYI